MDSLNPSGPSTEPTPASPMPSATSLPPSFGADAYHVSATPGPDTDERLLSLYRALLFPRLVEEKMLILLRQGLLSKWFSGIGQEAIAVGVTASLAADDWVLPMHRNLGVFTARGVPLVPLLRQLLGREGGFTAGRDRTFHFGLLPYHIVGMISHLGAMLPVANGLALAAQLRDERRIAVSFTGEGATSEGDFHEAVNLAAVWKLPVVFVIENNQYGLSTPTTEQYACARLADRGIGYGVPGVAIDGNDVRAVIDAVSEAASRARRGEGPTLIECQTFRMRGHEEASGTAYVPKALMEHWAARDPIARFEASLRERGLLTAELRDSLRHTFRQHIDMAVEEALQAPEPTSTVEQETSDVYATPSGALFEVSSDHEAGSDDARRELRYVDAIAEGLREAMRASDRVVLLGQDIAEYGGVFKVTQGFVDEFGKARVRNTPIIESGALGAALGLALDGFRPIVEMQFGDFITCGFNQIVNNLAKTHYRWGAGVPVVIRAPIGGGTGAGPYHSQNIEAWFAHVAGLCIVAPASPADAKGLLLAAIDAGNPVLYLEHKLLYRSMRGAVPAGARRVPLGRARVVRRGTSLTVVTWSVGVSWALAEAETFSREGFELEVIDLRTLLPWDRDTVLASVGRTSRALVLHEAPLTAGFGAEVAATIGTEAFDALDAPVTRVAGLDTPIPFARALEDMWSPRARLHEAIEHLLRY